MVSKEIEPKEEKASNSNQSTLSNGPKGIIIRTKKPITELSQKKEELQVTYDGYIRIKRIIKRTVGRGSDPDKIVWHKHKWTTITKRVSSHPRGKTRSIANLIFAMIRKDYDNFNLPEPLLPPVIIESEPEPVKVQKEKGSPRTPSKEKKLRLRDNCTFWSSGDNECCSTKRDDPTCTDGDCGFYEDDSPTGSCQEISEDSRAGVQRSIDQGIPSMARETSPKPKIKMEPKVNDLNNLLSRVKKVRKELNGSGSVWK